MPRQRLGYGDALAISWAVNWRLVIANILMMLVMGGLVWVVRPLAKMGALSAVIYFALSLMVVWPFVVRQVVAAHGGAVQLLALSGNNNEEALSISYWRSILLALVVESVTVVVALLTVFVLALGGIRLTTRDLGAFNLLTGLLRLLLVMPVGIKLFARSREPASTPAFVEI